MDRKCDPLKENDQNSCGLSRVKKLSVDELLNHFIERLTMWFTNDSEVHLVEVVVVESTVWDICNCSQKAAKKEKRNIEEYQLPFVVDVGANRNDWCA